MTAFRHFSAALALVAAFSPAIAAPDTVTLTHVHGLAYSADGKRLMIPSHHGLAVFENGRWSKAEGPDHDYMGFTATAEALYSSGHPARGSGLTNPFGVIRSTNGGRKWDSLGMSGETDFHLLAAGYHTNAIYVLNPAPNSRMKTAGLFSSPNDGFTWHQHALDGVTGEPTALAADPADPEGFALGTSEGVYVAQDGKGLQRIADGRVTALWFDLADDALWVGRYTDGPELARLDPQTAELARIDIPVTGQDAVAYVAQNPAQPDEYAIATFRRNVFVSTDAGRNWGEIAREGRGIDRD